MRIAWWILKATSTHSECVVLTASPLQPWLHEQASLLRITHIACPYNKKKKALVEYLKFMETTFYAPTKGDLKNCTCDFAGNNGAAENNWWM